jgi:glycosyltransferase involved in cell wall biosynthesis
MKVSIITVCFNSSSTILETINSVNSQTYSNIEHVFIDGASSDNTVEIITNKCKRQPRIISEKDKGIYHAMNKGINISTGDIIGFLNADDVFFNDEVIENIIHKFKDDIDCTYGNLLFIKNHKVVRKWRSKDFRSGLFKYSWTPAHPTFYCRKRLYDKFGNYREDLKIGSDVDLMFRFLEIEKVNSLFINKNLVKMRIGGVSTRSLNSSIIITKELMQCFHSHGYNYNIYTYIIYKIIKGFNQISSLTYIKTILSFKQIL